MADITKTVSDIMNFSVDQNSDGLIENEVSDTISASGVSPSGRYEDISDTMPYVADASGNLYSADKDVQETISFSDPSGVTDIIYRRGASDLVILNGDYYNPYGLPIDNHSYNTIIPGVSGVAPTQFSGDNKSVSSGFSVNSGALPSGQFTIISPSGNSQFYNGEDITFLGEGSDELGEIVFSSLIWYSSLDGIIGRSYTFKTGSLSIGNHKIKVSSVDQGQFFSEVDIEILESNTGDRVEEITYG
jgi:hypothetical protein